MTRDLSKISLGRTLELLNWVLNGPIINKYLLISLCSNTTITSYCLVFLVFTEENKPFVSFICSSLNCDNNAIGTVMNRILDVSAFLIREVAFKICPSHCDLFPNKYFLSIINLNNFHQIYFLCDDFCEKQFTFPT